MKKRLFGRTGESVCEVGLGTHHLTSNKDVSRDEALRIVDRAISLGVNFIDTAPVYGGGEAEEILGIALEGRTEPYLLANKVGHLSRPEDYRSFDAIIRQFERSLKLLRREQVDVIQIHEAGWAIWWSDNPSTQFISEVDFSIEDAPVMQALRRLQQEGRARFVGISGVNAAPMAKLLAAGDFDVVQAANQYDLIWRYATHEVIPIAQSKGVAVVLGGPFRQGLLAKRHPELLTNPPERFTDDRLKQFKRLYALLDHTDIPIAELGLRFLLSDHRISIVIPGPRTVEELLANIAVSEKEPLPEEVMQELSAIGKIGA